MSTDSTAVRTGAGVQGGLWTAPLGTTAPTTPTAAYGTGWLDLGLIDESGITESSSITATNVVSRNGSVVRVVKSSEVITIAATALETNGVVSDLFYPGSTRVTASAVTTRTVKTRTTSDRRAFALDTKDGSVNNRRLMPSAEITVYGDLAYKDDDGVKYPITITLYPDSSNTVFIDLTDDPHLAAS